MEKQKVRPSKESLHNWSSKEDDLNPHRAVRIWNEYSKHIPITQFLLPCVTNV